MLLDGVKEKLALKSQEEISDESNDSSRYSKEYPALTTDNNDDNGKDQILLFSLSFVKFFVKKF
jgi:hypothetical protein